MKSRTIGHFEVYRIVYFYCDDSDHSVHGPMWGLFIHDQLDEFHNSDAVYGENDFPENLEELEDIFFDEEGVTCFFHREEDGVFFSSVCNEYELQDDYHICQIDSLGRIVYSDGYSEKDVREFILKSLTISTIVECSGLSNAEFCRENDIVLSSFYRWKNGSRKTPPTILRLLAEKYKVI